MSYRQLYNAHLLLPVHLDGERALETHPPDELGLLDRRHGIEHLLVVQPVVHIGVDGEISYAQRGQVLEEMGALTRMTR